jgi:NAD(P)-dependent dehydrogenase (short-subunit alcohol dehydrogenase family)
MEFRDRIAVITGAGSGIGRGTAMALANAGMHIVVADLDEASAKETAEAVRSLGVRSIAVQTDVASLSSVEDLARSTEAEFGAVHVVHNNAGVSQPDTPCDQISEDDWRLIFAVNVDGVFNGIRAFVPRLRAQEGRKHIVNTSSIAAAAMPIPLLAAYSAAKSAVFALSETLRTELAGADIGVSVLCPGYVMTNLTATTARQRKAGLQGMSVPEPDVEVEQAVFQVRAMEPEEAGRIVRWGIENNEPYIFTHPELRPAVAGHYDEVLAAFDRATAREGV